MASAAELAALYIENPQAAAVLADIEDRGGLRAARFALTDLSAEVQKRGVKSGESTKIRIMRNTLTWADAGAEEAHGDPTDLGWRDVTVAATDRLLNIPLTDELRRIDDTGAYNVDAMIPLVVESYALDFSDAVAGLAGSVTESVGVDADPVTRATITAARNYVEKAAGQAPAGSIFCVLSQDQWNSYRADLESAGGSIAYRADLVGLQAFAQAGYAGSHDGIDFWTSAQVPEGTDGWQGMMGPYRQVWYAELPAAPATASQTRLLDAGPVTIEEGRDPGARETTIYGQVTRGIGFIFEECFVQILGAGPA